MCQGCPPAWSDLIDQVCCSQNTLLTFVLLLVCLLLPLLSCHAEPVGSEGFGSAYSRQGGSPMPVHNPTANGSSLQQQLQQRAATSNGFLAGDGSGSLQPGAALLRQLQAATMLVGGSGAGSARGAGDSTGAFGDPAIMSARMTRSTAGPPPGFGGPAPGFGGVPPAASRGPPPGSSFPVASSAAAAQPSLQTQPQARMQQSAPAQPPVAEPTKEPAAPQSPVRASAEARASNGPAAAAVSASPRSSRGGKKKRGGKGRPAASSDGHSLDSNGTNGKGRRHNAS